MNLAPSFKYAVQTGWSLIVSIEQLFPLTGFRATEFGVDCCVFNVIVVVSSLMSVAPWLVIIVTVIRGARMWRGATASQPAVLARAEAGHECREGRHGLWFFLAEVSGEPFVTDIMLKGRQGFGVRTIDYLVLSS